MTDRSTFAAGEAPDGTWSRPLSRALWAVLLLGVVIGWFARQPALTTGGDEATYVILSESLDQGQYRDEFVLGTPRHAKYPPGMPAWLLVLRHTLGDSPDVARGANLVLLALTALLAAQIGRILVSPLAGVAIAAAVIFNPTLVMYAGTLLSEIVYALLSLVALWALLTLNGRPVVRWPVAIAVAASLAGFLTRSVGITLLIAIILTVLVQYRKWLSLVGVGVLGLALVAWFRYVRVAGENSLGRTYGTEVNYSVEIASSSGAIAHAFANARDYLVWVPSSHFGFPAIPDTGIENLLYALVLIVPALVGVVLLARRWTVAAVYLAGYVGMLLVWPFSDSRLAAPLLPLVLVAIAMGYWWLARIAGARRPAVLSAVVMLFLAGAGFRSVAADAIRLSGCRQSPPYADPACHSDAQRDWMAATRYIADSLDADAIIATMQPAPLYLETRRRTVPWERLYQEGADTLLAPHGRVSHALVAELGRADLTIKTPAFIVERCEASRILARFGRATFLLSFLPADSLAGEPACQILLPPESPNP